MAPPPAATATSRAPDETSLDSDNAGRAQRAPEGSDDDSGSMGSVLQDIDEQLELYRVQISAVEEQRRTIQMACNQLGSGISAAAVSPASGQAVQSDMAKILTRIDGELEHLKRVRGALILHAKQLREGPFMHQMHSLRRESPLQKAAGMCQRPGSPSCKTTCDAAQPRASPSAIAE